MPETTQSIGKIVHDITHSWYFRIWGALWVFCAIVVFAALIVLSMRSSSAANEQDIRFWITTENQIYFPRFHLRMTGNETILQSNCWLRSGAAVGTTTCQPWNGHVFPPNSCLAVNSDSIAAVNNPNTGLQFDDNERVYCNISTTGNSSGNTLIAWEIEGNETQIGSNSYASIWIAPNNAAWVMLEKSIIGTPTGDEIAWRRSLLYHSTVSVPGYYLVNTIVGSFQVSHWYPTDSYNGWMSIGQIGGFAFFLVILHSMVMLILGIFMTNDSKLLNDSVQ